ncbi:MAG: patatin-like phospholipase family protein [Pirellulaceae bacterium]|nr:patatin-like phospholipase family protein [Pirellulaceae bacterium]
MSTEDISGTIALALDATLQIPTKRNDGKFRILSLDGGGSKGFYTLGVLREIEAALGCRICEHFDLVYGTSTGAIIASLITLGRTIDEIHSLYKLHVPTVMSVKKASEKSAALAALAQTLFEDAHFTDVKTGIGIVATRWATEKPMIFKASVAQAHGRPDTFVPGFGVKIGDAVQASCSAMPFFDRKLIETSTGDQIELIDGGFCANNPTLYAIADAIHAMKRSPEDLRVVSVGVGVYPEPKPSWKMYFAKRYLVSVQLLQKTLEINTQSMDQLRRVMFKNIKTVRVSDTFERPEMACEFMEYNLGKLNMLRQQGSESYAKIESEIRECLFN